MATFLCGKQGDDQGEEGGEEEHVRGQGEDDTPEGWTFLNIDSFVRTELHFLAKSESEIFAKIEFCMLVFW